MRSYVLCAALGLGLAGSFLANAQPRPKTQAELEALQAMFQATDPDAQITAALHVIEKFADTQFKSIALQIVSGDYEKKGDFPKSVTYGERALEADPKNYEAMIVLGREYARNTKDSDFDKDAKLKKADGYANDALAAIKTAVKQPNMPDDRWQSTVNGVTSDAYDILGQVAIVRKDPATAIAEYNLAVAASADPVIYARLAVAYNKAGKYDEAIAAADKAMTLPNSPASVKQFAQAEKSRAAAMKTKAAAPQAPATPPAPGAPASAPNQ